MDHNLTNLSYQCLTWLDFRAQAQGLIPEFISCIDALSPNKRWPLLLINFPYGYPCYNNQSTFLLPENLPNAIREAFDYGQTLPLGLVTKKNFEACLDVGNTLMPLKIFQPGMFFGLENSLTPTISRQNNWQFFSGSRALFSLPKISSTGAHRRLQKIMQIKTHAPRSLIEQWQTFFALTQSNKLSCTWRSQLVLFSKPWLAQRHDPTWQHFYCLLQQCWLKQNKFLANFPSTDIIFNAINHKTNRQYNTFLMSIFKQLLSITCQQTSGLCFAEDDQAAPISFLSECYTKHYLLTPYSPCFMHSNLYSPITSNPIYFPLNDTFTQHINHPSNRSGSQRATLEALKDLLENYEHFIRNRTPNWLPKPLQTLFEENTFRFYHPKVDLNQGIYSTNMLKPQTQTNRPFCYASPLLKGVVEIKPRVQTAVIADSPLKLNAKKYKVHHLEHCEN